MASLPALLVATMACVKSPDQGNTGLVLERGVARAHDFGQQQSPTEKRAADSGRNTDNGTAGRKLRRPRRPAHLPAGQ